MPVRHHVIELQNVTDADLRACLNDAAAEGWELDHIDYLKEPGVRRPQMAFVFFTRPETEGEDSP